MPSLNNTPASSLLRTRCYKINRPWNGLPLLPTEFPIPTMSNEDCQARRTKKTTRTTTVALLLTLLPIAAHAGESSERLVKDLDKTDCARIDARMQSYLQENQDAIAALAKLGDAERKKETQSYRKAFE